MRVVLEECGLFIDKKFICKKEEVNHRHIDGLIDKYSKSICYKSLYHAFRVLDECEELMETGKIEFPLRNRDLYMQVRNQEIEPEVLFKLLEEKFDVASEFEKSDKNVLKTNTRNDSMKDELWLNLLDFK